MTLPAPGRFRQIAQRCIDAAPLSRSGAGALAQAATADPWELLHAAWRVRRHFFGRAVRMCSIVPGKLGGCAEDCKWCAQSARQGGSHAKQTRRTSVPAIVAAAAQAHRQGASSFGIVNSGRRPTDRDLDDVIAAKAAIDADDECDVSICASLGELDAAGAARLAQAGITRYHHNLETSRRMFGRLVTTHSYDDRLATLRAAKDAGMRVCCGGLFGMGETWDDRIDLAMTIRDEVHADSVPLNFLNPAPGTPLEAAQPLSPMECLSIVAVFRLILPTADIKVAGGREVNLRDMQSWIFYAGATSCLTGDYLTTPGRGADKDHQMVADLGLELVTQLPRVGQPQPAGPA